MKDRWSFLIKESLKIMWIAFAFLSVVIWLPQTDGLISRDYSQISTYISLDDGWDITINGSSYQNISLDGFHFEAVNKGDSIYMQRELPEDWDIAEAALRLYVYHSAITMYIDDQQVYEYGFDRLAQNKTIGSGTQFINFPDEYKGKTLKIELYISEDQVFTKIDSIRLYAWQNAYRALLTENRIPMFLGSFLVIFGLSTVIVTMFALVFSWKYVRLFSVSAFAVCVGLWTLCYYDVILAYAIPLYAKSLIEYISLYLAPIPLMVYMHENVRNLKNKVLRGLYWVLFTVQVVFDFVIFSFHAKNIVHCAAVSKYVMVIIVCELLYLMVIMIMNMKSSELSNRLYLIGMLIVAACIGYDLINYYSYRYFGIALFSLKGVSSIGVMVFIFILIITFYMDLTQKTMREAERNSLIKQAYTDEMTQLYNRRYCSEYMEKINKEKIVEYAVVCFDLNNLKIVNDTYGHIKGDILIKSAAKVISGTFEKYGVVGRMGGDEFIALLKTSHKEEIERLIQRFQDNIAKMNREETDLNMSISYGYAVGNEIKESNIEKIYQVADNRMYENKNQYKAKRNKQ